MAQVLVVDDDPLVGGIALAFLREAGHVGHWVSHGNEALQLLHWRRPDLALIAQHMQGMPGSQLIRSIRASDRYGDLPILLMTMSDSPHDHRFAERAGADGLVAKPLTFEPLILAASRALATGWAQRYSAVSRRGPG